MRICLVANEYPLPTETFVYESVEWLRRAGHRVDVVTSKRGEGPGLTEAVYPARVVPEWTPRLWKASRLALFPVQVVAGAEPAARLRGVSRFTRAETLARATLPEFRRADAVLAHFGPAGAQWLPVVAAARRPFAIYFHGFDVTSYPAEAPDGYRALVASDTAALTNSEYLRQRIIRLGFAPSRVAVVRLGVAEDLTADDWAAPLAEPRLLSIARLVPKKGLDDSIRAFAAAQPALQGRWRYQIVGDGPLRGELQVLARSLGVAALVEFSGYLTRPATLAALRSAAIFMLASKTAPSGDTEGTPVSILEAATVGLPIVSTLHAGIPELVPPEAEALGMLRPEGDTAGLAAALAELGTDPERRRAWGDACRAYVRPRHSAEAHARELAAALGRFARVPK